MRFEQKYAPATKRECTTCRVKTRFDYNPNTGHSFCTKCGEYQISRMTVKMEGEGQWKAKKKLLYDEKKGLRGTKK
jgi:hypothetical protein